MVFARFRFKKMLVFQAKHNFFICPNERVRRQTHRKQLFMAVGESFLGRKLEERGKNHYNILTQFSRKMLQDTLTIYSHPCRLFFNSCVAVTRSDHSVAQLRIAVSHSP